MSTAGLNVPGVDDSEALRDQMFYSSDGAVNDVHVTKFRLSIDELLHNARFKEPTSVLDHIREVVIAVRSITGDVEMTLAHEKDEELARKRDKLKGKVSATANNVITAARNFAAAQGLSPVSLLDAAASHLTAAIIDLLCVVKVRPTPAEELDDEKESHLTPVNENGYFKVNYHVKRPSAVGSVYSALSDPEDEIDLQTPLASASNHDQTNGTEGPVLGVNSLRQGDVELEEFKVCLKNIYMDTFANQGRFIWVIKLIRLSKQCRDWSNLSAAKNNCLSYAIMLEAF